MVLRDYLPPALRGLMVAAFLAAYMSTIGTQLNWGTSYLVNDFYRRFLVEASSEKHYVFISKDHHGDPGAGEGMSPANWLRFGRMGAGPRTGAGTGAV